MSTEATVIAVAAALYLADCVVLLERGQALYSRAGLRFGSLHYQLRSRVLALLNPFTPFLATFRTRALFSDAASVETNEALRAFERLGALAALQLLLILAAMPYCLLKAPGWPFLLALIAAYGNALLMLGMLWRRFARARIGARPLAALGFGWLACLPLSINALRRAALAFDVAIDAREAIGLLPAGDRERARSELAAQVAEALQELDDSDERHRRLVELKAMLAAESRP